MTIDIVLMFDKLVAHMLLKICALRAEVWHAVNHVHHEVKAIEIILDAHVERCRDRALFLVAADVQISVVSPIGETVD